MSYFDALTIAAVVAELQATIIGGRIQRVLQPSPLSIALEIYNNHRRHQLLFSASPQFARMHLSKAKPSRGVTADTPLLLLLRKYVNGGRIMAVEQPNLERVIMLSIAKRPHSRNPTAEEPEPELDREPDSFADDEFLLRSELIAELMERRSNLILVNDENRILGCARRITAQMSRRVVLPNEPYEVPPPQEKRDPHTATPHGIQDAAMHAQPDAKGRAANLARVLVDAYRGVSPLAAREVVFRATGTIETMPGPDLPWEQLATSLRGIWLEQGEPCLALRDDTPVAFAPYMLTHLPNVVRQPGMSEALEAFYTAGEQLTNHQQRRDALQTQILDIRDRTERQRSALAGELEQARKLEQLRWEGEMIFAYLHTITPRQTVLQVTDEAGNPHMIQLDPNKSAVESAQQRFRAYDKAKSAVEGVPERLRTAELKLAGIAETLAMLELAEGFEAIETIATEATEQGLLPIRANPSKRKPVRIKASPLRLESSDGMLIYVGRSAGQNEIVTFKLGSPEDIWMHVRNIPGSHVIIKSAGREVSEPTLLEAAGLAAYFSKHRNEQAVEVDYARRIQVRRIRGGPPGLVSYHAEGTVRVAPRPPWR
jgi:predicted ribosome quality control (RQC) complex YloA/Tae2 family protein